MCASPDAPTTSGNPAKTPSPGLPVWRRRQRYGEATMVPMRWLRPGGQVQKARGRGGRWPSRPSRELRDSLRGIEPDLEPDHRLAERHLVRERRDDLPVVQQVGRHILRAIAERQPEDSVEVAVAYIARHGRPYDALGRVVAEDPADRDLLL